MCSSHRHNWVIVTVISSLVGHILVNFRQMTAPVGLPPRGSVSYKMPKEKEKVP